MDNNIFYDIIKKEGHVKVNLNQREDLAHLSR